MRTPLNSIVGFSELLSAEMYGPLGASKYKEYAEIIHHSGRKLLKLVNQVLEIARLEGNAVEWELRAEPLRPAVEEALTEVSEEMADRNVTASIKGIPAASTVIADARGLRTVLSGLIHNAVVFCPIGGKVEISARRAEAMVDIRVHNAGEGFPRAELSRLLLPFEQGENAIGGARRGAGLGLPICALTCQAMNGRLALSSAPGKGLTARVRLPGA